MKEFNIPTAKFEVFENEISAINFLNKTEFPIVIKADGRVSQKELDFVRSFFIGQYGKERADSIFKTFNTEIKRETQHLDQLTQVFVQQTAYETRLQILHFLFGIASADGHISDVELQKISQVATGMRLRLPDFESIKADLEDHAKRYYPNKVNDFSNDL